MIDQIIEKIFQLNDPAINASRRLQISDFIRSAVNGDTPTANLVVNSNLGQDRKGVLVYILTNTRLIKIEIDESEIQSASIVLSTITNIERKLIDGKAHTRIYFSNDFIGLRYQADNQGINDFFQEVDKARTVRVKPDAGSI